jgi:thymidylate synthase (FAD)
MDKHHESVIEHGSISVYFTNDRGVSHEEVRHRLSSFSQESTRYCNYAKDKFGDEITIIDISGGFPDAPQEWLDVWLEACADVERHYMRLIDLGAPAQFARSVLNNSLKTELVWTANPREWRHIFKMRTASAAHPQMREVMVPLLAEFKSKWPSLFGDLQ